MNTAKKLGIWMDHASAHLMPYPAETEATTASAVAVEGEAKEETVSKGDQHLHNKEENELAAYYKELGEAIKHYDEVLLFGPTDAKVELYNLLTADTHFAGISIMLEQADKMTDNQQHAFVRAHFSKN